MSKIYDPYQKRFPRGKFLNAFSHGDRMHLLYRTAYEDDFEKKNPTGFHHDLGAQDVFLDNFGLFLQEQLTSEDLHEYGNVVRFLMQRWELLQDEVLPRKPFWGKHFNSAHRDAHAGEPRGLFRLMRDEDWSDLGSLCVDLGWEMEGQLGECQLRVPMVEPGLSHRSAILHRFLLSRRRGYSPGRYPDRFGDWSADPLVDSRLLAQEQREPLPLYQIEGVRVPDDKEGPVRELQVLHPRHSTPDLELRVGTGSNELRLFKDLLRDQGQLGTCTSHAVAVALDLQARRMVSAARTQFSCAWLHCASRAWCSEGRSLESVITSLRQDGLPCQEKKFPYDVPSLRMWSGDESWRTVERSEDARQQTERYGALDIRKLEVTDISLIKTYIAAGWSVMVTTTLTKQMIGPGFQRSGLALVPSLGQHRIGGHAWLLVGYDHTDGNDKWKYQGVFIALNSWGSTFPTSPAWQAGLCYLPFAALLTEGIDAYALRFSLA